MNKVDKAKRKNEMLHLRYNEQMTLSAIGRVYGLRRSRVHAIIGNTGRMPSRLATTLQNRKWLEEYKYKTNSEIAEMLDCNISTVSKYRSGTRHAVSPGNTYNGMLWEDWFSELLKERGIENKLMPVAHSFDILALDYIRIEVRTAITRYTNNKNNKSPTYRFPIYRKKDELSADILALIIAETEDVFIIPSEVFIKPTEAIIFCWPTMRPELAKWQKYHNRYDLISRYQVASRWVRRYYKEGAE